MSRLDPTAVKKRFPLLRTHPGLHFLDSGASSQKPDEVIDAMNDVYRTTYANVHRGIYPLAQAIEELVEGSRAKVARLLGRADAAEVVFTKNATEALNLVAFGIGARLGPGDVIVLTELEHHSNIVPWQMVASRTGAVIRWIPVDPATGRLDLTDACDIIDGAKVLAITAQSNVLGTRPPVSFLAGLAHDAGAVVVVDGCQAVPHGLHEVEELGADFFAFSGHKMCGPSGVGVLWGRRALLEELPPFLGGGDMILKVTTSGFTPAALPHKFEAGTPPIAEIVGLGAAIDFLEELGWAAIAEHDRQLTRYARARIEHALGEDVRVLGPTDPSEAPATLSMVVRDVHPHDVGQVLAAGDVCVRAGHHCAEPLMRRLKVDATTRATFYVYSTEDDVDALVDGLADARWIIGGVR